MIYLRETFINVTKHQTIYSMCNKAHKVSHFLNIASLPFHLSSLPRDFCHRLPSAIFSSSFFFSFFFFLLRFLSIIFRLFLFFFAAISFHCISSFSLFFYPNLNDRIQKITKSKRSCINNFEKKNLYWSIQM